jgi:uncharacterized repeat protein (TIGR02543 family)
MLGVATGTIPCNGASFNGYQIAALTHGETRAFSKPLAIANGSGTGTLSVTCANGLLDTATAPESKAISCASGFVNTGNGLCSANLCGGTVPVKAHMLPGSTQSASSSWAFAANAGTCTFGCDTNYTWNGSTTCVADTRSATVCNGSIKPNAADNSSVATWTQTWDGAVWNPVHTYARSAAPGTCTYDCVAGYSWDGANQVCALNSYTVTFDANGGSAPSPATKSVAHNAEVGSLATATYAGYSFDGWYTAITGGVQVTASTVVTGSVTWYARWSKGACVLDPSNNAYVLPCIFK